MTDAPERIWAWPKKSWFTAGACDHPVKAAGAIDVEYIRADLHDAQLAALRDRVEALQEVADGLVEIVEGVSGAVEHGTWRADGSTERLKDTLRWARFYAVVRDHLKADQ